MRKGVQFISKILPFGGEIQVGHPYMVIKVGFFFKFRVFYYSPCEPTNRPITFKFEIYLDFNGIKFDYDFRFIPQKNWGEKVSPSKFCLRP